MTSETTTIHGAIDKLIAQWERGIITRSECVQKIAEIAYDLMIWTNPKD